MPVLSNRKHERFAMELAKGSSQPEAYEKAGYKRDEGHASRLASNGKVQARVVELREKTVDRIVEKTAISRIWVLDMLRENLERALQHKAVTDGEGNPLGEYVYNGNVANRALELIGKELGMFVDRKEIKHVTDLDGMTDMKLIEVLAQETQALLEDHSEDSGEGATDVD